VKTINFCERHQAADERELMLEALASNFLEGDGPFTARATSALEGYLGGARALLTTSCTHALELASLVMDIGAHDHVVVPSYTFSSTANAAAFFGARLQFADVDPGTLSLELPELEAAITPETTAVVLVPYGGVCRDLRAIVARCDELGLKLIVDAAHALFAKDGGEEVTSLAPVSALSFHNTKNIGCGEGGAFVTTDEALLERATIIREKGTDRTRFRRGLVDKYTWRAIGSSYLPSDILAALLLAQLQDAEASQARRLAVWRRYDERLRGREDELGIRLQEVPAHVEVPAHLYYALLPPGRRREVAAGLKEDGILAVSHYEPLHLSPAGQSLAGEVRLPVTEDIYARLLRLPLHSRMDVEDADYVVDRLVERLSTSGRS
jgi:dTDP-4-amino-4,6-dideoxygalactose transaminase